MIVIEDKELRLRLRSLGAGVEEEGRTVLSELEAAYFAEVGVLPYNKEELIKKAEEKDAMARKKYEIIKYLRERGYIIRDSFDGAPYLRVYRKGFRPGEDRTHYLLRIAEEIDRETLMESLDKAGKMRKELCIALPDKKPKFIKISRVNFE